MYVMLVLIIYSICSFFHPMVSVRITGCSHVTAQWNYTQTQYFDPVVAVAALDDAILAKGPISVSIDATGLLVNISVEFVICLFLCGFCA